MFHGRNRAEYKTCAPKTTNSCKQAKQPRWLNMPGPTMQEPISLRRAQRLRQFQNYCGICKDVSMNFIINMLKVKNTFEKVCNSKTSDDEVFKLREKYFN